MTGSGRELGVSRSFPPSVSTDWEWANVLPLPSFQPDGEQIAYQQTHRRIAEVPGDCSGTGSEGHICHASRKQEGSSVDL